MFVIMGGGLGGLACAHELAQAGVGSRVIVIEQEATCGGLARSGSVPHTGTQGRKDLPTEICWRIYGPRYFHLLRMMKEIPVSATLTAWDHLVPLRNFRALHPPAEAHADFVFNDDRHSIQRIAQQQGITPKDKQILLQRFLQAETSSPSRLREEASRMTWQQYIDSDQLSPTAYTWAVKALAPFLGVDCYQVSASAVLNIIQNAFWQKNPGDLKVLDGPTNDYFIDPWVAALKKQGVTFLLQTTITELIFNTEQTHITEVKTASGQVLPCQEVICSLSLPGAATLVQHTLPLHSHEQYRNIITLSQRGYQKMVGVQCYFTAVIEVPDTALYLPQSPWQLVIEPQGKVWRLTRPFAETYGNGQCQDLWSIGLDDPYTVGTSIAKPWTQCSVTELQQEIWHQILTYSSLGDTATSAKKPLRELGISRMALWPTPVVKYSPNVHTAFLRPPIEPGPIQNLYFGAAYAQVPLEMHRMETAVDAGVRAAYAVMKNQRITFTNRSLPTLSSPWWLRPLQKIDHIAWSRGWKHPNSLFQKNTLLWIVVFYAVLISVGVGLTVGLAKVASSQGKLDAVRNK